MYGATTSPGRYKEGTALSPLNFRKMQKYSSAAEERICVMPRKEIESRCSAGRMKDTMNQFSTREM